MATANKQTQDLDQATLPDGSRFRVGIAVSQWNDEITHALRDGALHVLQAAGVPSAQILVRHVPGAFELPLASQWLLQSSEPVDGVIAIGSVIRGETAHFDFICDACASGILKVGLQTNKPVVFCVLTDDHIDQSRARSGGILGNKGAEAAVVCLEMLTLKQNL